MGSLDDVLGSAVPKGNLAKPLIIALGALLASGAYSKTQIAALHRQVRRPRRHRPLICKADLAGC